jgi:hypothetical protein
MEINMPSITVIVPAYKKAKILEAFVLTVIRSLEKLHFEDYEILIITNPSENGIDDETSSVAKALETSHPCVKSIHLTHYANVGFKFRQGVRLATKDIVSCIFCATEITQDTMTAVLSHVGEAEVVLSYTANMESRAPSRVFLSRTFTRICNLLFGLHLVYYNGIPVYPRVLLQSLNLTNDSFAYNVEAFVSAIKTHPGLTYVEVPIILNPEKATGAAFKMSNIIGIGKTTLVLFWRVWFRPSLLLKK